MIEKDYWKVLKKYQVILKLFCAQMGKFKENQLNQMIDEFLYVLVHNLSVLGDEINNEKREL